MENPLQRHKDEFEDRQLAAVDRVHAATNIDVDFAAAETIGLIRRDVLTKIQRVLPNHAEIFRNARARIEGETNNPNVAIRQQLAFRRAFNQVYGKFLFERENLDLPTNTEIARRLAPVLKFPIDHEHWLEDRNELQSAIERAKLLVINDPANAAATPAQLNAALYVVLEESFRVHAPHGGHGGHGPLAPETEAARAENRLRVANETLEEATAAKKYFENRGTNGRELDSAYRSLNGIAARQVVTEFTVTSLNPPANTNYAANYTRANLRDVPIQSTIASLEDAKANYKILLEKDRSNNRMRGGVHNQSNMDSISIEVSGNCSQTITALNGLKTNHKNLYERLHKFAKVAEFMQLNHLLDPATLPAGVTLNGDIGAFLRRIEAANPDDANASFGMLLDAYDDLQSNGWLDTVAVPANPAAVPPTPAVPARPGIFDRAMNMDERFANAIPRFKDEVHHAETAVHEQGHHLHDVRHLTDSKAAQRIMETVMRHQHPELTNEQQRDLATMVIASDVSLIQNTDYEGLARRSSQAYAEILQSIEFRQRILSFKYKQGDRVVEPFKGFRAEDLDSWEKIEALFNTGKLDLKGGMFLLAGFNEVIDPTRRGVHTRIHTRLRDMVVKLMAKELGVEKRMNEAGVAKIVGTAVDEGVVKYRDTIRAFNIHYDKNSPDWDEAKVKLIKAKKKDLDERRRLKKITTEEYEEEYAELREEIREMRAEDLKDYMEDPILHNFWNSPAAQWVRDGLHNIGRFTGKKALSATVGTLEATARGIWGTTKLGFKLGYQAALTPFRVIKYPALLAAKPFVWTINLFKKEKIELPGVFETAGNDWQRIKDYTSGKVTEVTEGTKQGLTKSYVDRWNSVRYTDVPYRDRTKVDPATLNKRMEKLKGKVDGKPLELSQAPDLNIERYKSELAKLSGIVGGEHGQDQANHGNPPPPVQNAPVNHQQQPTGQPANPPRHAQANQGNGPDQQQAAAA